MSVAVKTVEKKQTQPSVPTKKPNLPPLFVVKSTDAVSNWLGNLRTKMAPSSVAVLNLITGYWTTQFIYVVANLNVADYLSKKPMTIGELAEATQSDEQSLYRVMRALASQGLFKETKDHRFKLTALGKCLRSDVPNSMRDMAIMNGRPFSWQTWGHLLDAVKTGESAFEQTYGTDAFTYFNQNPEDDAIFSGAMTSMAMQSLPAIVGAYDFSRFPKIADVAGGEGTLLATALHLNPNSKGVLFDRPSVIANPAPEFDVASLKNRVEFISGDFFESVPAGCDLYVLKNILHDFSDDKAKAILKNCRKAMDSNATLAVMEMIIPEGNAPFAGKLIDLEMMMMTPGGRERSEAAYSQLFEATGFKLTKVVPTISPMSIIEARPV